MFKNKLLKLSFKKTSFFNSWLGSWLPVLLWAGLIFYLSGQSSLPSFKISTINFVFMKTAHIVVYAILFSLINRALSLTTSLKTKTSWKMALLLTVLYAISDELHQSFIPNRYGTIRDIGYDTLGASLIILRKLRYI